MVSAEENKAIFLRFVDELRKGNTSIVDDVCSPNFAFHSPNHPDWPSGLEGARQLVAYGLKPYRDNRSTIEDVIAEGDKIAVRWTITGIYIGKAKPGFPTPGEAVTVGAMSMYRFVNGKIEEDWGTEAFWPSGISEAAIQGWSAKRSGLPCRARIPA
jgi:predicted ester cyclase